MTPAHWFTKCYHKVLSTCRYNFSLDIEIEYSLRGGDTEQNQWMYFALSQCWLYLTWTLTHILSASSVCQEEPEKHWDELKQYFGVNDRFDPPACSKPPPKVTKTPAFQLICKRFNTVSVGAVSNNSTSFMFPCHCMLSLFYVTWHMDYKNPYGNSAWHWEE